MAFSTHRAAGPPIAVLVGLLVLSCDVPLPVDPEGAIGPQLSEVSGSISGQRPSPHDFETHDIRDLDPSGEAGDAPLLALPLDGRFRVIAVRFPSVGELGVCYTQIARVSRPLPFSRHRIEVEVPPGLESVEPHEMMTFEYVRYAPNGVVQRVARCRIPRSQFMLDQLTDRFSRGLQAPQMPPHESLDDRIEASTRRAVPHTGSTGGGTAEAGGLPWGVLIRLLRDSDGVTPLFMEGEGCDFEWEEGEGECNFEGDPGCTLPGVGAECDCTHDEQVRGEDGECFCENGSEYSDCWLDDEEEICDDPAFQDCCDLFPDLCPDVPPGGGGDDPPDPDPPADSVVVTLSCSPGLVTRGDEIQCTAAITPANDSAEFSWRFEPDSVTIFPGDTAWHVLGVPVNWYGGTTLENGHIWEGPLVLPGKVIVTATHEPWSNNYGDTTEVSVLDRQDWMTPVELHGEHSDTDRSIENHPDSATFDLGLNVDSSGDPGVGFYVAPAVVEIESGPNRDYIYFESTISNPGYVIRRRYWINDHIKAGGPPYVIMDTQDPDSLVSHWHAVPLLDSMASPSALYEGVKAHERFGTGGHYGHQKAFERPGLVQAPVCGNVNFLAERIAGSVGAVQARLEQARERAAEYLRVETGHWLVHGNFTDAPLALNTPQGPQLAPQSDLPGTKDEHNVLCPAPPGE